MNSLPTRKQAQKNIDRERRIYYCRKIKKPLKFIFVNIILSFIISVIAFNYVSFAYDTEQVKEEILKDNITTTITQIHGVDGVDIPFNIDFLDFEKVSFKGKDTDYIDIKFRIIQNGYPNDSIKVELDGKLYDDLDDIQFRIKEKRESPTHMQLILYKRGSNERVGFATFDINQNFKRSIEAKLEIHAKSWFSKTVQIITNKLLEVL